MLQKLLIVSKISASKVNVVTYTRHLFILGFTREKGL
jgi:hypothetical protein